MASLTRAVFYKIFGKGFYGHGLPVYLLIKVTFFQKILGFNRGVPWPVHWTSRVTCPSKINRGTRYPGLSMGCHIDGRNGIKFGKNVCIGPRVSIVSMNHNPNDYYNYIEGEPIIIGENCWLGANSVILPHVELGEHTVVAAGAVVTHSFLEGNQIIAGVPAKVVKKLGEYEGQI